MLPFVELFSVVFNYFVSIFAVQDMTGGHIVVGTLQTELDEVSGRHRIDIASD